MNSFFLNKNLSRIKQTFPLMYSKLQKDKKSKYIIRNTIMGFVYLTKLKETKYLCVGLNKDAYTEEIEFNNEFRMYSGASSVPHYKKKDKGGEDYFLVNDNLIVVADGVGGWNNYGVDPSKYSKEICENIKTEFKSISNIDESTAKNLIINSSKKTNIFGSR